MKIVIVIQLLFVYHESAISERTNCSESPGLAPNFDKLYFYESQCFFYLMEDLKLECDYFLILIKNFESLNTEVQTNKYRKKGQFATKYCSTKTVLCFFRSFFIWI